MSADTIDWLENIGNNAALRHASPDELARVLTQGGASDALIAAAMSGNSSLLAAELGHKPMHVNHDVHTGGHEEEPDHDHGEDVPNQPPTPDKERPGKGEPYKRKSYKGRRKDELRQGESGHSGLSQNR